MAGRGVGPVAPPASRGPPGPREGGARPKLPRYRGNGETDKGTKMSTLSQAAITGRIRKIDSSCVWQTYTCLTTLSMIVGTPRKSLEMSIFGQDAATSDFRQAWSLAGDLFARMAPEDKASVRLMGIDEAETFAMAALRNRMTVLGVAGKSAWLKNKDYADAAEVAASAKLEADAIAAAKAEADAIVAEAAKAEETAKAEAHDVADAIAAEAVAEPEAVPVLSVAHIIATLGLLSDEDMHRIASAVNAEAMRRAEIARLAEATKAADAIGASKAPARKRTVKALADLKMAS